MARIPLAPKHLRKDTRTWWRSVVREWELQDHEQMLLTSAAETWDRIQECREVLDEEGVTYTDRFGQPKPRPEVSMERLQKLAFAKLIKALDLVDAEPPPAPRRRRH